jgi:hypothetical protein
MTQNPPFDASIPVLTEVFKDQPARTEAPEAQDELERRLSERILQQLQGRIDVVLEQRVRDSMEGALQRAMAGLTDEIRRSLQQTIEKIVVHAVAQELTHVQGLKK